MMAIRNTFFIAGYGPLQRSHQGHHKKIAGYGAGFEPLQRSQQGDHHEEHNFHRRLWTFSVLIKETIMRLQDL